MDRTNAAASRTPEIALTAEASVAKALIGGSIAAVVGGGVWALIAGSTGYEIGWIAIGVGFLCGFGVRLLGKGSTNAFRAIGAGTALFGIVLGKLMTIGWAAHQAGADIDLSGEIDALGKSFSPIDLLFYGIALWEGWKFAVATE